MNTLRTSLLALCGFALASSLDAEPLPLPSFESPSIPDLALRFSDSPARVQSPPPALDVPKPRPLAFVGPNLTKPERSFDPFVIVPKKNNIGAMPTVSERPDIDFKMLVIAPPQTGLSLRQSR